MAGKKSTKQTMDEWEQQIKQNSQQSGENLNQTANDAVDTAASMGRAIGSGVNSAIDTTKTAATIPFSAAKSFGQGLGIVDKDAQYYIDNIAAQLGRAPTPDELSAIMQDYASRVAPIANKAVGAAQKGLLDAGAYANNIGAINLNTPYDKQMQDMDMQVTPETQAYWQDVANRAQAPMAQRAGGLLGDIYGQIQNAPQKAQGLMDQFKQGFNKQSDQGMNLQQLIMKAQSGAQLSPMEQAVLQEEMQRAGIR